MKLISLQFVFFLIDFSHSTENSIFPHKIDLNLINKLKNQENANLIISFGSIESILHKINNQNYYTREDRLNNLYNSLTNHAQDSQENVIRNLQRENLKFKSFWVTNQIFIKNANLSTISFLEQFTEIISIAEEIVFPSASKSHKLIQNVKRSINAEWGVENVDAPQAWALGFKGQGVKVGIIDTGIRWTHEGFKNKMANGYYWFDPTTLNPVPYDDTGFGTHSTGVIVGSPNMGVAPEAKYISCLGCPEGACSQSNLIACGQFITCPHDTNGANPNCAQAPDIVSNGWLNERGQTWYNDVIDTWRVAGILPIFSVGNNGPACGTVNSPGDNLKVIGVGAIPQANNVFPPSSRGPSSFGGVIKPDFVAPGLNVVSASHTSDNAYATYSGTSLAAAHLTGVVAILKSKNLTSDYFTILNAMRAGAGFVTSTGQDCGGIDDEKLPNNNIGAGRVSALKSLDHV